MNQYSNFEYYRNSFDWQFCNIKSPNWGDLLLTLIFLSLSESCLLQNSHEDKIKKKGRLFFPLAAGNYCSFAFFSSSWSLFLSFLDGIEKKMKYIRTSSLKRLFSLNKRHSFDEEIPTKDCEFVHEISSKENLQRPTWKCFSYQEIFDATNGFSPGTYIYIYIHIFFFQKNRFLFDGVVFFCPFLLQRIW